MNKFSARAVEVDGIKYPSKAEANRHQQLKLMERARAIRALAHQPKFPLVVGGVTVGVYTADFVYFDGGRQVVEDVKGIVTEAASLRMRLFMALHPSHELRIVDAKGGWKKFVQRNVSAKVAENAAAHS